MATQTPELVPDDIHNGIGDISPSDLRLRTRGHQMFPVLSQAEVGRMRRFGEARWYDAGDEVFRAGVTKFGMMVVLKGCVEVSCDYGIGNTSPSVQYSAFKFIGEVSQMSGLAALNSGKALSQTEVLLLTSEAVRALLVAEAELGERIVRAFILRRIALIEVGGGGPVLIGPAGHARMFHLQSFLASNTHPHTVLCPDKDEATAALVARYRPTAEDWPLVICPNGDVMRNPSNRDIGRCLGILPDFDAEKIYDVLVVGFGPSGLATAVYAASEGLTVLALDQNSFGGQAAASARIENYLGFPTGITGRALAGRAYVQAQKFGVEVAIPAVAKHMYCDEFPLRLELCDGSTVRARSVVLSCGARYRKPALDNLKKYEGRGVYYWASSIEARLCKQEKVLLVGGGNSAGQAAVFLSAHASEVHMIIRGNGLTATMSNYLIERIRATPNIVLHTHTEVVALDGDENGLNQIRWRNNITKEERDFPVARLFLFIGAEPNAAWLSDCGIGVDDHGFIRTGLDVTFAQCRASGHPGFFHRDDDTVRAALETSVPGIFAIGDVRAKSTKRVAGAVGEGAAVVAQIHKYLMSLPNDMRNAQRVEKKSA